MSFPYKPKQQNNSSDRKLIVQIMSQASGNSVTSLYESVSDIDEIEVSPGETFKIERKYNGTIECDKVPYVLIETDFYTGGKIEQTDNVLELSSGKYEFKKDGLTIEKKGRKEF